MNEKRIGRPRTIDPEAVSLVALRLFDDGDYDHVSMDDVAVAAGISRRYLFRLFPTKASLVWGGLDEFILRFHDTLKATPDTVPALTAITAAYKNAATFPADALETTRHRLRVIAEHPTLASEAAGRLAAFTRDVSDFIGARDGRDRQELAVAMHASALTAGASAALTWWALHSEDSPENVLMDGLRLMTVPLT